MPHGSDLPRNDPDLYVIGRELQRMRQGVPVAAAGAELLGDELFVVDWLCHGGGGGGVGTDVEGERGGGRGGGGQ